MPDIRNNCERDELHKTIWSIANELRGSVDGWDFKQYFLQNYSVMLEQKLWQTKT